LACGSTDPEKAESTRNTDQIAPAAAPEVNPAADHEAAARESLTEKAQNPIPNLISMPFQNNTTFGLGPNGDRILNVSTSNRWCLLLSAKISIS
jgi:hypothetical protein